MHPERPDVGGRLLSRLPRPAMSRQVEEALAADASRYVSSAPTVGEMWRLEFDGTTSVVVMVDVEDDTVRVVPVGEDPHMADESTLVVESQETPLGFPVGLWIGLEIAVPTFTVDIRLGTVGAGAEIAEMRSSLDGGRVPNVPVHRRGGKVTSALDPRTAYRVALREPLQRLAATHNLLTVPVDTPEASLRSLLTQAQVGPAELRKRLGWSDEYVRRAFRDELTLSEDEVDTFAQAFGFDADAVRSAVRRVNPRLLVRLHLPRRRRQVHLWAAERNVPDVVARRQVAAEVTAGSRRVVGSIDKEPDWEQLLDDFFEDVT